MPSRLTRMAADVLRVLPRKRLSRAMGSVAARRWPRPLTRAAIALFERTFRVDATEYEVPEGGFDTFGEFFARPLRAGARPIDPDDAAIVSPADGTVADRGPIAEGATLLVKGRRYSVGDLLGDREAGERFVGGWFFMVYLHPRDYHRVHAPIGGPVHLVRHVPGTLFPVNEVGESHIDDLFVRNERVVVFVGEDAADPTLALLMIGALGVGRISLSFTDLVTNDGWTHQPDRSFVPPVRLARGEEVGTFHMGSTAVVLVPPGSAAPTGPAAGDRTVVGARIGHRGGHVG